MNYFVFLVNDSECDLLSASEEVCDSVSVKTDKNPIGFLKAIFLPGVIPVSTMSGFTTIFTCASQRNSVLGQNRNVTTIPLYAKTYFLFRWDISVILVSNFGH